MLMDAKRVCRIVALLMCLVVVQAAPIPSTVIMEFPASPASGHWLCLANAQKLEGEGVQGAPRSFDSNGA